MAYSAEFTTSKFSSLSTIFFYHFPGLNWPLKDVKHLILVLQDSRCFIILFSYEHLFDM